MYFFKFIDFGHFSIQNIVKRMKKIQMIQFYKQIYFLMYVGDYDRIKIKNFVIIIIMVAWLTNKEKERQKKNTSIQINMVFNKRQCISNDTIASKKNQTNIKEWKKSQKCSLQVIQSQLASHWIVNYE